MTVNPQLLNQTRLLVEKYDESLKINAALNAENRSLRADITNKEANTSTLIEHYQDQICDQTTRLEELKELIRCRDIADKEEKEKRRVCEKSISAKMDEARSKEVFLLSRIQVLEEEVERLTCTLISQRVESERKHLADQLMMKESFEKKFECTREKLVSKLYGEMGDVLANTLKVNDKLTYQLKSVLAELESINMSRQEKEKELLIANRMIKLLQHKEKKAKERKTQQGEARGAKEARVDCI